MKRWSQQAGAEILKKVQTQQAWAEILRKVLITCHQLARGARLVRKLMYSQVRAPTLVGRLRALACLEDLEKEAAAACCTYSVSRQIGGWEVINYLGKREECDHETEHQYWDGNASSSHLEWTVPDSTGDGIPTAEAVGDPWEAGATGPHHAGCTCPFCQPVPHRYVIAAAALSWE